MSSDVTVLCKDCKHSFRTWPDILLGFRSAYAYKCRKNFEPDSTEVNLVVGQISNKGRYQTCSYSRLNSQLCKEVGELWEPKDSKKHFFTIMQHEEQLGQK